MTESGLGARVRGVKSRVVEVKIGVLGEKLLALYITWFTQQGSGLGLGRDSFTVGVKIVLVLVMRLSGYLYVPSKGSTMHRSGWVGLVRVKDKVKVLGNVRVRVRLEVRVTGAKIWVQGAGFLSEWRK
eukprot:1318744-Amorphochlora_amoeboformis.AAC.1